MASEDTPLIVTVIGSTVTLSGEVDIYTAPQMEKALLGCIQRGCEDLTVDFSGVTYFDSSGIQALLRARAAAPADRYPIQLVGVNQHTSRILRLVGIERFFQIQASPVKAM